MEAERDMVRTPYVEAVLGSGSLGNTKGTTLAIKVLLNLALALMLLNGCRIDRKNLAIEVRGN